uniref:Uncharacterized protein n=1 Tax=Physcomitrium patens TaxID=3218 RepID=A0A2K1JR99_PHYPA|nr:hypothetical protein PHYPA_016448 [Physcomitrium patens]
MDKLDLQGHIYVGSLLKAAYSRQVSEWHMATMIRCASFFMILPWLIERTMIW